jgi:serine/threonine protein kinase
MAPEIFRGEYDEKVDVYALAVILFIMLEGEHPNVEAQRKGKEIVGLSEKHPNILRLLFEEMIEPDPRYRVSIYHVY